MPVTAICPQCQATYKLAETFFGKQVRCKQCTKVFLVGGPAGKGGAAGNGAKKPIAKKTMMADEDAIREETPKAPRPTASPLKKSTKASPAPAAPAASSGQRRSKVEEEEAFVETAAAAPRRTPRPPTKPEARPAKGEEDLPLRRGSRPTDEVDDDDRPRRPDRDRDRSGEDFDDDNPDAPPKKSRKGLMIGLMIGGLVLLGGGMLLLVLLLGGGGGGGGPKEEIVDSPELALNMDRLKEGRERPEAIAFFASFDAPEKQKRRLEVVPLLETVFRTHNHLAISEDQVIIAYTKWATEEHQDTIADSLNWAEPGNIRFPDSRRRVMDALAAFKNEKAAKALAARVTMGVGFDRGDRGPALSALETMGDLGKKELSLLAFSSDFFLRGDVRRSLERMGASGELVDGALRVLGDKTHKDRRDAVDFFRNLKDPPEERKKEVCEKLMAFVQEKVVFLSDNAAQAIPKWLNKDAAAAVGKALKETDKGINCEAIIKALAIYKDVPEVPEGIAKRMESTSPWGEPDTALKLLLDMGPDTASKYVLAHMNSANGGLRNRVRNLLTKYGIPADAQVGQSIKDLGSPTVEVKRSAVDFLAKTTLPLPKLRDAAAKALLPLVFDEDRWHKGRVFEAMAVWYNKDTYVMLYKLVNDPSNPEFRNYAMNTMAKIGDPTLAPYIAYRLKIPEDRREAGQALRSMGPRGEASLWPYLLDTDKEVRQDALRILEQIGTVASVPTLEKAIPGAPDPFHQKALLRARNNLMVKKF